MTIETNCPLALPLRRHITTQGTTVTIVDANDETVALFEHQRLDGGNAAEIVRRVNLHDELVAALRELRDYYTSDTRLPACKANAVLAKVEGR